MVVAREARSVPGVIETLSAGFESINRMLWILAFPIGIDLLLWAAPRLSVARLISRLFDGYMRLLTMVEGEATGFDVRWIEQQRLAADGLREGLEDGNLLGTVARTMASIPSIHPDQLMAANQTERVIELVSLRDAVGAFVLLQLVGLFIGAVYYGLIAQQVRDGRLDPSTIVGRATRYWLSMLGFIALLFGLTLGVGLPVGVVIAVLTLVSPLLGAVVGQAVGLVVVLAYVASLIYLFFLVDAIVVSEVGPIRAALSSVRVVHRNFWPALGLLVLLFVISAGMGIIWNGLGRQPFGLVVGIVGNAYVMSGLIAASMLFYRHRAANLS
ncbi:MAG: hypothetical protein HYY04_04675 [Chloroflexi bacterium]|nr:hypothetical protein [Chloroflexota bacterium]